MAPNRQPPAPEPFPGKPPVPEPFPGQSPVPEAFPGQSPAPPPALLAWAGRRLAAAGLPAPARWLLVDVARQRLWLIRDGRPAASWPVSTAAAGIDGREGSGGTPPGVHVVARKIGGGMELGTVFRDREPTGEVWRPVPAAAPASGADSGIPGDAGAPDGPAPDLILTRILTLEGREPGVNAGPGCDSLARYVYLHGTNDEARLGRPVSHGCVRLANADVAALFELVAEGDPVVVQGDEPDAAGAPAGAAPEAVPRWLHFAGVGGSGMSALAQYHALGGGRASGSDRAFDRGERAAIRRQLEAAGVTIAPQDGSGLREGGGAEARETAAGGAERASSPGAAAGAPGVCDAVVVSTAVEESVPDVAAARLLGVPVLHRAELLARFAAARRTIAVTGTSGKSTVVAMIFEILRGTGRDPSVITGGELVLLREEGRLGNAWAGGGDLLVIEADESDGSLVRYEPWAGVLLNLQRDHKEPAELAAMFAVFRARTRGPFLAGEDANLDPFAAGAARFGLGDGCDVRAEAVELGRDGSRFAVGGTAFTLPAPGLHNVRNAVAAIAACRAAGVPPAEMAAPLARFRGVARRFQVVGTARGVEVVDDFAHNPDKIAAALAIARARGTRVLAVFQPHGYGPTRFLRDALIEAFAAGLRPTDRLWLPEIYYAGGTVTRDVSSRDIVDAVAARGVPAFFAARRADLVAPIAAEARAGDVVLVMGARDPSLTEFCERILQVLRGDIDRTDRARCDS